MFSAVVLAGGAGRRVGGAAKPTLRVGGRAMLSRVLEAVAGARPLIVVGPDDLAVLLPATAALTRESPPGGGPVAAIAAGLAHFAKARIDSALLTEATWASAPRAAAPLANPAPALGELVTAEEGLVAVVASDLPFLTPQTIASLCHAAASPADGSSSAAGAAPAGRASSAHAAAPVDGAVLVDSDGRPQWLAGVWRLGSLVHRIEELGDPAGRAVRDLVGVLRVTFVPVDHEPGPPAWFDCDTAEDLRRAEEWTRVDFG